MFIRMMLQGANTDEEYRRKLEDRQKLSWVTLLMGSAAVIAGIIMLRVMPDSYRTGFLSGLYCGVGASVIVADIISLIKVRKLLKDEALLHRERIKESDERKNEIAKKAAATAVTVFIFILFATLIVSGFFSMEVFWTLWGSLIAYFLIFIGFKTYYAKKN